MIRSRGKGTLSRVSETAPPAATPPSPTPYEPRHKRARIGLFAVLAAAIVGTFAGEQLGWITTVATRSRSVERPAEEVVAAVRSTAAGMPRWTAVRDDGRVLEYEARTALLGFTDDVRIQVDPVGSGASVHLRSASRLGASDFGTNGRRLEAFLEAFDARIKAGR